VVKEYDAIFTNPNKSKVYIGRELLDESKKLKVVCSASTGTNHIDVDYAIKKGITVLSLTEEREVIEKISSTAEHAFALMMSALRNIPESFDSVKRGEWDYTKFIGRQLDQLTVGVVGFGRLGRMFSGYCKSFGSKVIVYDPYANIPSDFDQVDLSSLLKNSDVISIHIHVNDETKSMIDKSWFSLLKEDVLIVNTSRGEVINERELISFLGKNPESKYATDVVSGEVIDRNNSEVISKLFELNNIIITPHIGGMTKEAQRIAYNHSASMLKSYLIN